MAVRTPSRAFISDIDEACRRFAGEEEISIDLETSGLNPFTSKIAVISLHAPRTGDTAILHTRGHPLPERLRHALSRPHQRFTHHNGTAFDLILMHLAGIDIFTPRQYDTMIGELVTLASGRRDMKVSLAATTQRRLGKSVKMEIDHGGWMNEVLTAEQEDYCLGDIQHLHRVRDVQTEKVAGTQQEREMAMEMELIPVTVAMSLNGLPIKKTVLHDYIDKMRVTRAAAEKQLFDAIGVINLRSPLQLRRALAAAGLPLANTRFETIRDLELRGNKLAGLLLMHRHADQRIKMYTDEWEQKHCIPDENGFLWVHSRFWQCGTDTGRFSSSDPNLQQVPRDMRAVFGGIPGMSIVSVDYSQLEVRWAAERSKDRNLIAAFKAGGDSHRAIASQVFGKPLEQVTDTERKTAKAMVFCLLFGGSAGTLYDYAKMAGSALTAAQCETLVAKFFNTYQGLRAMKDQAQYLARQRRPVTITMPTGLKRVLVADSLRSTVILNTTIQGSAASGIKLGMLRAKKLGLHRRGLGAQVHDELVACVPEAEAADYGEQLRTCMVDGMAEAMHACPVVADVTIGSTWNDELIDPVWDANPEIGEWDGEPDVLAIDGAAKSRRRQPQSTMKGK